MTLEKSTMAFPLVVAPKRVAGRASSGKAAETEFTRNLRGTKKKNKTGLI